MGAAYASVADSEFNTVLGGTYGHVEPQTFLALFRDFVVIAARCARGDV